MNLTLGLILLAAGAVMVWLGVPKGGVSPAFMRNSFMGMLYTVACLALLVCGIAGMVIGTGWSLW